MLVDDARPMGYYRAFKEIRENIPDDALIVAEGASTMDISRQVINNSLPRHRLDAGTWGTMGVGLPQAIAAQIVNPDKVVIDIQGDSAFGFSGMEVEGLSPTCRSSSSSSTITARRRPTSCRSTDPAGRLLPDAYYERVIEAFGTKHLLRQPGRARRH
jgi:2-hydroxyacyl-CoA lyase 1